MFDPQILAFAAAVGVLTLVPGADTMLVMRSVLTRGRRAGFATAFGIGSGLFVQATISALGLSAILMRSVEVYSVVKMAGALYLIGLGVWTIVTARRPAEEPETVASPVTSGVGIGRSYIEGLLTNVLNPKIVVFYLAFLPQFIAPSEPVVFKSMQLAGVHFVMTIVWLSLLTLALTQMSAWISRPKVKRRLDYFTGTVLVGLGARLALEKA